MRGQEKLLKIEQLCHTFVKRQPGLRGKKMIHALNEVTIDLHKGETLAIVGESDSGKSTLAQIITGLIRPSSGMIQFRSEAYHYRKNDLREQIYPNIRLVGSYSTSSLNPMKPVGRSLEVPLKSFASLSEKQRQKKIANALIRVGLIAEHQHLYPHEFSAGERQRIALARAIITKPQILVTDDLLAGLDVSVRAQLLNLLLELQAQYQLSYIFISHDLAAVEHVADTVAVMYNGQIVEQAPVEELFSAPAHPYTISLMRSARIGLDDSLSAIDIEFAEQSPSQQGCPYSNRCQFSEKQCSKQTPETTLLNSSHWLRCHYPQNENRG